MKIKTATHTPGPWVLGTFSTGPRIEIVDPISGHPIAEVINWDPATMDPEEQYYPGHPHYHGGRNECANVRLIAAAPELLEAAKLYARRQEIGTQLGAMPPSKFWTLADKKKRSDLLSEYERVRIASIEANAAAIAKAEGK